MEGEIFESVKPGLSAYADQPEKVRLSFIPWELVILYYIIVILFRFYQAVQVLLIAIATIKEEM